jgi:phosphonopyruvate decarboxylase
MHPLNPTLMAMDVYASKAISQRAKADSSIANLSFGEPVFGPPEHLLRQIDEDDLSLHTFLDAAKRYEDARGDLTLRQAIAHWYWLRYGLTLDPETEIMVTHGGVEAITLALLATTSAHDSVAISDPSYMLYARTIQALERRPKPLARPPGVHEYVDMLQNGDPLAGVKAMIVNSPENPSAYVASADDWQQIGAAAAKHGVWIIHDEVYDVMDFERRHCPARTIGSLAENAILVNSFSKKFGLPGLRIGWLVAPAAIIDLAAKAHDYLYLGVNIQYERIALRLLNDAQQSTWLSTLAQTLERRALQALSALDAQAGFSWPRQPMGAMFLFPEVSGLYACMPASYRAAGIAVGDAVARYLLEERKVAVVPGSVYGRQGERHVRMVLCSAQDTFERAIAHLRDWPRQERACS